jgi:hypothetical protein
MPNGGTATNEGDITSMGGQVCRFTGQEQ